MDKFRIFFTCYLIFLLLPQTPKSNLLLRLFYITGFFTTYREAENFLRGLTVGSMFVFLFVNYFLAK